MPIESRTITNREEWKAWRRADLVTASGVGGLFGYHPFTSKLKLYVAARGVEFNEFENMMMKKGRIIEPSVAAAVREERPEWTISPAGVYLRDPELKLGATPDFFVFDPAREGRGVLQAKTTSRDILEKEWDGGTRVPDWIRDQVQTEAMLSVAEWAVVAALVVERYYINCAIIEVPIDFAHQARIVSAVIEFADDVRAGREPSPDFEKDAAVINARSPFGIPGSTLDLTGNNSAQELLARRAAYRERITDAEAQCEVIETELKFMLGDAEMITGLPGWRVTWRMEHRKGYTVEPSDPRVLRIYDRRDKS
jgi:predicted phage-related endonuclease